MDFDAKDILVHVKRGLALSLPVIYRSGCDHPFVWCMLFFLFVLYRYLPSLFTFVVSSLPVVICTSLLLGIILAYADTDISETEEDERNVEASKNARAYSISREMKSSPSMTLDDNGHDQNASSVSLSDNEESSLPDDEDEAPGDKDDADESVLKWTEIDQKNLMDLGTSEMERNKRLENLIAKQKVRKFLSFHYAENNLIDLDTNDSMSNNFQVSSVSAPRRNPLDAPFEEDASDLPHIPGSAPSVLQPRQNPFDSQTQVDTKQGEQTGHLESDGGDNWVAPLILASVDEIESRSKEINEIKEQDVIQVEDIGPPIHPILPSLVLPPRLSFTGSNSDDNAIKGDEAIDNMSSSCSSLSAKPLTPTILHSETGSFGKDVVTTVDLLPIVEEPLEYLKIEDEHESIIVEGTKEEVGEDVKPAITSEGGSGCASSEDGKPTINKEGLGCALISEEKPIKKSNGVVKRVDVFSAGALKFGKIGKMPKFKFGAKSKHPE